MLQVNFGTPPLFIVQESIKAWTSGAFAHLKSRPYMLLMYVYDLVSTEEVSRIYLVLYVI